MSWTPGTGTDDTEQEKHIACERGGFALDVWADSFVIEFQVNGSPSTHISQFFDDVHGDLDIGTVLF